MDLYEKLVDRFSRFILKKVHNKVPLISNKDRAEVKSNILRLYNDLTTLPMFFTVCFADQMETATFAHMLTAANYMNEHNIPISAVYEKFIAPYDKFIVYDGATLSIVSDFCPENHLKFKMCHFAKIVGSKGLGCQLADFDMSKPLSERGTTTHVAFIEFHKFYPYMAIDAYERLIGTTSTAQSVLTNSLGGFNNFIIASVFSHFDGEYTEANMVKKHTQKRVARRDNVFRVLSFNIKHAKRVHESMSQRKGHKLQYQSDMPRMLKYMRHERYSQKGTLPLQYDLEGKPYYYTVEVDPFTRGKELPRKEDSIKYKVV